MKDKLTFITASAGTGKTFRLVEEVFNAVKADKARPEAVIATTFTRDSANELKERLSSKFHAEGLHDAAARLENDALISTVHGICFRLLSRFAFEAGISPDLRVIDEAEAKHLLDHAIDSVVDESVRQRIYGLASRLGQRNTYRWTWNWRGDVKAIVEAARSNDLPFSELPQMGAASWAEMKSALGDAATDDLDAQLLTKARAFLDASAGDTAVGTGKCRRIMEDVVERLTTPTFPWSSWEKITSCDSLGTDKPGKAYEDYIDDIGTVTCRVGSHPRLHADIENYLTLLFDLAERAGEAFTAAKTKRGTADFADLEKATLDLLRDNETVRDALADEIDLLLVDEFQDTSPIQLALFAELGQLANRVLWVGDVKQSIYGFRGSDPELIFQAARGAGTKETLDTSWRSVPDLVELTNAVFAPVFRERLGIPEDETEIYPHRISAADSPAVEVAAISSGETTQKGKPKRLLAKVKPALIAEAVTDLLSREETVTIKSTITKSNSLGETRPLTPGDVAVLVRTGKNATGISEQLRARGFDVSLSGPGLLSTPEAVLALACLRRWIDPADSLAAAEIVALEGLHSVEDWLDHRLEFITSLDDGVYEGESHPWLPESSPALTDLHHAAVEAGDARHLASPLGAFDAAAAACDLERLVSHWGPGDTRITRRLAHLEQLRAFIADYESRCATAGTTATLSGLFGYLDDLRADEEDDFPEQTGDNAITVGTYHSAKGLEWPAVFMADLDDPVRTRLFNLRVIRTAGNSAASASDAIDFDAPLAGRELRLWIHPFGGGSKIKADPHPAIAALEQSPTGRNATLAEVEENLRLLYVGFTRARDRLIFIHEPGTDPVWFATPGEAEALDLLEGGPAVPVPVTRRKYEPAFADESAAAGNASATTVPLPRRAATHTERLPASLTPSSAAPLDDVAIAPPVHFGERLPFTGHPDERDLGDALHRIFAAEILHSDTSAADRDTRACRILTAFGLEENIAPADIRAAVDRYRAHIQATYAPVAEFVEVPFTLRNAAGQQLQGYIDHLLILPDGSRLIIDHKIYPGKRTDWEAVARSYSGQLATYADTVRRSEKTDTVKTAIHFVTGGGLVEVG